MKKTFLTIVIILYLAPFSRAATKWEGQITEVAKNSETWAELIDALMENQLYYGAMAAANRSLSYFSDLPTKQKAYHTVIRLIDHGYPHKALDSFRSGDLEPVKEDHFSYSYNFYKALINKSNRMDKWKDFYLGNIDKENFPKYQFFEALQAYEKNDLKTAIEKITKVLAATVNENNSGLLRKAARTLARIYYEQERFDKALDIYQNYLIRLNPVEPSDWLEAAWSEYQLKNYNKALGHLYNLESRAAGTQTQLEKYSLRAVIYRDTCAVGAMASLVDSFENEFGALIKSIKTGDLAGRRNILSQVHLPENTDYYQVHYSLLNLAEEQKTGKVPLKLKGIAEFLYKSEIEYLQQKLQLYSDQALEKTAEHLVMLSENIRFLKFDVEKQRHSPESIFVTREENASMISESSPNEFLLHWPQTGDFWRDERMDFSGDLKDQCAG